MITGQMHLTLRPLRLCGESDTWALFSTAVRLGPSGARGIINKENSHLTQSPLTSYPYTCLPQARSASKITLITGKDQSRIKNRKKVDIFLIPVLKLLQVQKAISYHLITLSYFREKEETMKKTTCFSLVLAVVFLLLIVPPARAAIPAAERGALIALYNSTDGDNWTKKKGWKESHLAADG